MKKATQAKDIPDEPILRFLAQYQGRWCTHGDGHGIPTVQDAMPSGTHIKLQLAKMRSMHRRNLVGGCTCGCRGDWEITDKGLGQIGETRIVKYNGY